MATVKESLSERIFNTFNIIVLVLIALIMLYPLWYELNLSLSSMEASMKGGLFLWPREFTIIAYRHVLGSAYIWQTFGNSLFVAVIGTALSVLTTACTAYPLTKSELPGRNLIMKLIIFTMLFSGGMIPTYLLVNSLGMVNTLWALIFPGLISAYNVIITVNFFKSIPTEMEESAFIDGANPIRIFFSIILPLSKPILATLAIWIAVGLWNDFFSALIYINDEAKYTLPIMLRSVISGQIFASMSGEIAQSSTVSVIGATIIITVLPILCVYPFLQKYFVKGAMVGSIKG